MSKYHEQLTLKGPAMRSLQKLARLFGDDLYAVPLYEFDDSKAPAPAYTDHSGIHVGTSIFRDEPQNLHVYLAHEVMHHVVRDDVAESAYPHDVNNLATDLIINYVLHKVYRIDVRKVEHVGVYDTKIKNKTVIEACAYVVKVHKLEEGDGCGCHPGMTHPALYRLAEKLRAEINTDSRFAHLALGTVREIVKLDSEDDEALFQILKQRSWRAGPRRRYGGDINMDLIVRAIFGRLYARTVRYDIRKDMPFLGHEHGIALSLLTTKLRRLTVGDAAFSLVSAQIIVEELMSWGTCGWKGERIYKLRSRISGLREKRKMRSIYSKSERKRFDEKIKRLKVKIAKIESQITLHSQLTDENRLRVKPPPEFTGSHLVELLTIKEDHKPRLRLTPLSQYVRRVMLTKMRELRKINDTSVGISKFLRENKNERASIEEAESMGEDNDQMEVVERQQVARIDRKQVIMPKRKPRQGEDEGDSEDELTPERERKRKKPPEPEERSEDEAYEGDDPDDDEVEDEEDTEDADDEPGVGSSEKGKDGKSSAAGLGSDGLPGGESSDSESEAIANGASPGGNEAGIGQGDPRAVTNLEALDLVRSNQGLLSKILIEADFFAEKLANASKAKISENSILDRTFTYGDDIQRADSSVVAKMANKHTRLAFFADVANQSLLQHVGTEPRRGSLILSLDCSGSMSGAPYIIAAGFTLAMFRVMNESRRGCALIKFASNVDGVYVCDERVPVDMVELLKSLITPSLGGTNFDCAMEQSLLIQETFEWKDTQMILVTDAGGIVSKPAFEACAEKMRLTALVVGHKHTLPFGIPDVKSIPTLEDLRNGLITFAHAVL